MVTWPLLYWWVYVHRFTHLYDCDLIFRSSSGTATVWTNKLLSWLDCKLILFQLSALQIIYFFKQQQKAFTVNAYMRNVIHDVILSGSEAIPSVNIDKGVFTCRISQTQTTFRTMINGTREASAVQAAADIQKWVESGPVVKVEWYLVDITPRCPVSIDSLTEEECIEDQCVESCVAVCRARG